MLRQPRGTKRRERRKGKRYFARSIRSRRFSLITNSSAIKSRSRFQRFITTRNSPTSSNAQEKPTLYEVKDGAPNLINFDLRDGVYIAPKVVDKGYLVIGKHRLDFERN